MKALKFTLSGKTAFFKRPDVNQRMYFTFSNIHKVALLGLFGTILGLNGYNQQKKQDVFPEFYEELKDIKIAIVPKNRDTNGIFRKKLLVFNNSVGYASQEEGNNLIVREQTMENVEWDIFVLLDNSKWTNEICDKLKARKTVFTSYLGKNEHLASISNIEEVDLTLNEETEIYLESLVLSKDFIISNKKSNSSNVFNENTWYVRDRLPIGLNENNNLYILEETLHSNTTMLKADKNIKIYKFMNGNIVFM